MHDAGDFGRAAFARDGVFDPHFLHTEMIANQRRERRHGAALGNVEPVQRYLAVAALVDVEDERNVAYALARSRRHRRARRDEAWAHHAAVAVLEIIARQLPLLLRRHIFLLFGREKDDRDYYGFPMVASASTESPLV